MVHSQLNPYIDTLKTPFYFLKWGCSSFLCYKVKPIKHLFFDLGKLRAIYIVLVLRTSIDVYDLFNGWYEKG